MSSQEGGRSSVTGLVPFLFGVAGVPELPGAVLTELLGEFGTSRAAARQQLARMCAEGQLGRVRAGRGSDYHLAGRFKAAFERFRDAATIPEPRWEGHFHAVLHQVPESQRAYRDRLRRQAVFVGYGVLQPGVLIAVHDRAAELADVVAEQPEGTQVRFARIAMEAADAAEVAVTAWDLPEVAAALRGHLAAVREALERDGEPTADADTLRWLARLGNGAALDLLRDPRLPAPIRPPDWPAGELGRALGRMRERFGPAATAYVHARLAAAGRAPD